MGSRAWRRFMRRLSRRAIAMRRARAQGPSMEPRPRSLVRGARRQRIVDKRWVPLPLRSLNQNQGIASPSSSATSSTLPAAPRCPQGLLDFSSSGGGGGGATSGATSTTTSSPGDAVSTCSPRSGSSSVSVTGCVSTAFQAASHTSSSCTSTACTDITFRASSQTLHEDRPIGNVPSRDEILATAAAALLWFCAITPSCHSPFR